MISTTRVRLPTGMRAGIVIGVALALVGVAVGTATGVQQAFQQVLVVNPSSSPVPVAGSVNVGNFPATQPVSGTVTIGNATGSPVPIVDVTQTEPVWFDCQMSIDSGDLTAAENCYIVPSGKRLVIQELSVHAFTPIGQVMQLAHVNTFDSVMEAVMHDEGSNGVNEVSVGSQFGVAYADGGTAVRVEASRSATTGSAGLQFYVNGYLVP